MAKPVISAPTSLLAYKQHETWSYQLYATESPTSWAISPLPDGVTFDTDTGLLSGPINAGNVFANVHVTATNGDGTSEPLIFIIASEPTMMYQDSLLELNVDVVSGEVTLNGGSSGSDYLFAAKTGDDLMLRVIFRKTGVAEGEGADGSVLDLALSSLRFSMKEYDSEQSIVISTATDNTGNQVGSGTESSYILHVPLSGDLIKGIIGEYEDHEDKVTWFLPICEIERVEENTTGFGPAEVVKTSRPFYVRMEREQLEPIE